MQVSSLQVMNVESLPSKTSSVTTSPTPSMAGEQSISLPSSPSLKDPSALRVPISPPTNVPKVE